MEEKEFYELSDFKCSHLKRDLTPTFNLNSKSGNFYLNRNAVEYMGFKENDKLKISFRFKEGSNMFFVLINPTDKTENCYSFNNKTMSSRPLCREIEKLLGIGMIGRLKHRFDINKMGDRVFKLKLRDSNPLPKRSKNE